MTIKARMWKWIGASRWVALGFGALIFVAVLVLIALSPLPMRGAEYFGAIANKIKGNPGATAYGTLAGVVLLWLGIGLLAAVQEWRSSRQRAQ